MKNAFLGLEHRCHTLMQVFKQHNEDYKKQYEAGLKSKSSYMKYVNVYQHLEDFLYQRYHIKDIALKELTPAFITDLICSSEQKNIVATTLFGFTPAHSVQWFQ